MNKQLENAIKDIIHWQIVVLEQIIKTIKYYNSILIKGK
jgi:hypothetical protein